MRRARIFSSIVMIVVAMALIAAGALPSKTVEIRQGQTRDIVAGKSGIHITDSFSAGTVKVAIKDVDPAAKGLRLENPVRLFDVRFTNSDNERVTKVTGSVYVFFNLTRKDLSAFSNDELGIFYFDPWFNEWKECKAYRVPGKQRIACTIRNFGLYALAYK